MSDGNARLDDGSSKFNYVTIVELVKTDGKGEESRSTMNLYASTPEGAFANTLQVEQLYRTTGVKEVKIIGTYGRADFVVVDRNKYTGDFR